ncbi:MAG: hypothetical protein FWD56_05995 [Bacteroidales bacterium]|nr:hypothetical protein [Bacteroidales bacterium]
MLRSISLFFFTFSVTVLFSQAQPKDSIGTVLWNFGYFSALESPEKVYLHTDKQQYCAGEYVWFNAYLENSSPLSLMPESNYVYVELIKDTVFTRLMIKRTPEGFPGRIPLETDLSSGTYTLRAYTMWMKNFAEAYMFHKEITVINPLETAVDIAADQTASLPGAFDIQFLPESGRYIPGDLAVVAFKAVDASGRGLGVRGTVYNSRDSVVASFTDSYNGMGTFMFYPKQDERYHAIVQSEWGTEQKAVLPDPSETGAVIHVAARDGKRYIRTVLTESLLQSGLFLVLSNGGEVFFWDQIVEKENNVAIEEARLFSGINHATIIDPQGRVYAQRIFFVYPPQVIQAAITADKPEPKQREKVTYTIQLHNDLKESVQGTFSLSVTDKYLAPQESTEHLLSYMLLSSELVGPVEHPAAYFDPLRPQRKEAIDLLMMTQGWRYYDLPSILANTAPEPVWEKEYTQIISGKASGVFNRVSRSNLIVYAPSIDLSLFEPMDRSGRFSIQALDFPDSTSFVLSCTGQRGSTGYYLEINDPSFPSLAPYTSLDKKTAVPKLQSDDILFELARTYQGEKVTLLEPAVVRAPSFIRPTINPSPFNQVFEPSRIRERKQLAPFDGMFLMDYILSSFPSVVRDGGTNYMGLRWLRSTRSFSNTGINEPVVYIDRIKMESTGDLNYLFVSDIENIVALSSTEAGALYNSPGGVILISTRRHAPERRPIINTKLLTPLGWQKPSQFYSPNYALKEDNDLVKYDNRTTLYWNPFVQTDENGVAEISFYTSDRKTLFHFSIEGITYDGSYFAQ